MTPKRGACTYIGVPTVQSRTCAGANRGIGFAAAQQLVDQGREVIVACRNEKKGAAPLQRTKQGSRRRSRALSVAAGRATVATGFSRTVALLHAHPPTR